MNVFLIFFYVRGKGDHQRIGVNHSVAKGLEIFPLLFGGHMNISVSVSVSE